jgi:hypothetical protein
MRREMLCPVGSIAFGDARLSARFPPSSFG